jgi:hypothetical protein
MRSNRRAERRPARPLGAMRDREVTTVTVFEALLRRFGFVQWGDKLPRHAAYSTYQKIERDPMVTRIRERLRRDGELRKGSGLFSAVHETEQALAQISEEAILRLRARLLLQDFRVTHPDDKGESEK